MIPRWQSHKVVEADRIVDVVEGAFSADWKLQCGEVIPVSVKLANRVPEGLPIAGGYYVRYADGFESWSPAEAFEGGYTLLPTTKV
jgi:hypothetical protein